MAFVLHLINPLPFSFHFLWVCCSLQSVAVNGKLGKEGSRKRKKKSSLGTFLTDEDQQFYLFSHYLSWLGFMAEKDSKNPNQWKARNLREQPSSPAFAWNRALPQQLCLYQEKKKPQKEIKISANTMRYQKLPIIIEFLTCQKFGEENKLLLMAMVLLFRALAQWVIKYSVIVHHQI